jgi:hypothetical protein
VTQSPSQKKKERENEEKESGEVVRDTTFGEGARLCGGLFVSRGQNLRKSVNNSRYIFKLTFLILKTKKINVGL